MESFLQFHGMIGVSRSPTGHIFRKTADHTFAVNAEQMGGVGADPEGILTGFRHIKFPPEIKQGTQPGIRRTASHIDLPGIQNAALHGDCGNIQQGFLHALCRRRGTVFPDVSAHPFPFLHKPVDVRGTTVEMTQIMIGRHQSKIRTEQDPPAAGDAVRQHRIFRPEKRFGILITVHDIPGTEWENGIAASADHRGNMSAFLIGAAGEFKIFHKVMEPFTAGPDHKPAPFFRMIDLHVGRL